MTDDENQAAQTVRHRVIEQAKASHKAGGGDMTFEQLLAFHATNIVPLNPGMQWMVGERNGAWTLDVWIGDDDDASTTLPPPFAPSRETF